jgi:predicted nucleic acid-binding protein
VKLAGTIIVSDTSPLNYRVLIGHVGVLATMYERVIVLPGVLAELAHDKSPAQVRAFAGRTPPWPMAVSSTALDPSLPVELGRGEREAISLAVEIHAHAILMDERTGCELARARGLRVRGTLGMIDDADEHGHLSAAAAIQLLRYSGFRADDSLFTEVLRRAAERQARRA